MTFLVEKDELPNPEPIGFFCSRAEVPTSTDLMNLILQARRRGGSNLLKGLANRTP